MPRGGSLSEALGSSPPRANGPGNQSRTSTGKLHSFTITRTISEQNKHSCIDTYLYSCFNPLSIEQKSMSISGNSCAVYMGWYLKILKMSPELSTWHYIQKALQTTLIISQMLLFAKTCVVMMLWRCYDVWKFIANTILFLHVWHMFVSLH